MKTLIIGIGNPILTDDGVGIRIASEIRKRCLPDVDVMEASLSGIRLLDYIVGYDRLIMIDSIKTEAGVPGTLSRLNLEDIGGSGAPSHTHGVNLRTAIELGRGLGYEIPERVEIYAVEVEDNLTFHEGCGPEMEARIPDLTERIVNSIAEQRMAV